MKYTEDQKFQLDAKYSQLKKREKSMFLDFVQGAIGISVPIINASNDATVAVLSVFMAETNFKENQLDYYLQKLKSSAQSIGNSIF